MSGPVFCYLAGRGETLHKLLTVSEKCLSRKFIQGLSPLHSIDGGIFSQLPKLNLNWLLQRLL